MRFVFRAKTTGFIFIVGFVLPFLLSQCARGQAKAAEGPLRIPPGVRIKVEANPKEATVGDPIRIDMNISMPSGYQVEVSKPAASAGDFYVMGFSSGLPAPNAGKAGKDLNSDAPGTDAAVQHHTRITIAVFRTGKFTFPRIPLIIKTSAGEVIAAESPPQDIEIRSVIAAENPTLKDLKTQADIPEPVGWLLWAALILASGAILALIWYVDRRRRRRQELPPNPVQVKDLLDIAEADLRHLLACGLPHSGEEKRYYVALSEITKRILEAGYGIHTAERTTSEIMHSLRDKIEPDSADVARIESFLSRCDVVKFAKYIPASEEHELASKYALYILAQVRKTVDSKQPASGSGQQTVEGGLRV